MLLTVLNLFDYAFGGEVVEPPEGDFILEYDMASPIAVANLGWRHRRRSRRRFWTFA